PTGEQTITLLIKRTGKTDNIRTAFVPSQVDSPTPLVSEPIAHRTRPIQAALNPRVSIRLEQNKPKTPQKLTKPRNKPAPPPVQLRPTPKPITPVATVSSTGRPPDRPIHVG
ncbi:MAG: hypothetical protein HC851_15430, partial [Acaryochloris sp. RU_4_1]|nr:hypothetical protein [Acaryochloris sp. RU_4_1]